MVLSNSSNQYMSVICRDCSGAVVLDLQAHGGGLWCSVAQTCGVIVDSKDVVGRRRRRRAGVHTGIAHKARGKAALSGLTPSVGGGMDAVVPRLRTLKQPTLE